MQPCMNKYFHKGETALALLELDSSGSWLKATTGPLRIAFRALILTLSCKHQSNVSIRR
jgi:hypothetical protein